MTINDRGSLEPDFQPVQPLTEAFPELDAEQGALVLAREDLHERRQGRGPLLEHLLRALAARVREPTARA